MRRFLSRRTPTFSRILLVESGSRHVAEGFIAGLHKLYGPKVEFDLVTCFAGSPDGFTGEVFRVTDYPGPEGRQRLVEELKTRGNPVIAIICSAEPLMTKWKWYLAWKLPAKCLIVNENSDYFWLDSGHLGIVTHFILFRAGLTGAEAVPALARMIFFPLTLGYLLLYAGFVHLRRALRT